MVEDFLIATFSSILVADGPENRVLFGMNPRGWNSKLSGGCHTGPAETAHTAAITASTDLQVIWLTPRR